MSGTSDTASRVRCKVVELAKTSLSVAPAFTDSDSLIELGLLDSPGIIQFILWIEDVFGLVISEPEVTVQNLGSVEATVAFITSKNDEPGESNAGSASPTMVQKFQATQAARDDLDGALAELGVAAGDTLLVHSDSTLAMTLSGADKWDDALAFQLDGFERALGPEGTLLTPTFNYDFCSGDPYTHESSPSQVGMFSSFVLRHANAVRSFHPIFSFAGIGRQAAEICGDVGRSSFGSESVFDRLYKQRASMVFFNASFDSCTFVHHVEQMRGVDYRYIKEFTGSMTCGTQTTTETIDFYVRYLDSNVEPSFKKLGERLVERGLMNEVRLSGGVLRRVSCVDVFTEAWAMLDEDPYSLLSQRPTLTGSTE
jgi:aminoglycoside 3-N-acetyltransferase